jgi:hypothetical protein
VSRFFAFVMGWLLLAASLPNTAAAAPAAPADTTVFSNTGYAVSDPVIRAYFLAHGGTHSLGAPLSNVFQLLGSRVQIFERQVIEARPDGSAGTLDLVSGYMPLVALGGQALAPDPSLVARVGSLNASTASAYLDEVAANDFNGTPVRFAYAYRSSVRCEDVSGLPACNGSDAFRLAMELWGLPIGHPAEDPNTPEFVYQALQRGVMVYSRRAGETQWLLLGDLFKQVLLGSALPDALQSQINASGRYSRFYAQYDPRAGDGLARPSELPGSMLAGAFSPPTQGASPAPGSPLTQGTSLTQGTPTQGASPAPGSPLTQGTSLTQGTTTQGTSPAPGSPTTPGSPLTQGTSPTPGSLTSPTLVPPTTGAPTTPGSLTSSSLVPPSAPGVLDTHFGVAEGFRAPDVMNDVQAGWERVVIPWDQVQPVGPGDFTHLGLTLPTDALNDELGRGVRLSGVLQFTPGWAQLDPSAGLRSPPKNLYLPFDDPNNYWGRFVYQTVAHYTGQIDDWLIWNEPDIHPSDAGSGGAWTWSGSDEDFAQLMKVAYLAAKKANPRATVAFPATSYWADELSTPRRQPFYDRLLNILQHDPQAAQHNLYHDAVALNLYRSPDDVYRVHDALAGIQHKYGIDKPIWLSEANAAPTDDPLSLCPPQSRAATAIRTTLDQQANYALQTFALGAAAGYQHMELYDMRDDDSCTQPAWGLMRADGSLRPVADAARTAITYFSNFTSARFVPLTREQQRWPAWPANPSSYIPNWQVYQVAFDRPGNERVMALWSGDGAALRVRIPKNGTSARLVSLHGFSRPLQDTAGSWTVDLPAATAHYRLDPDAYYFIGGEPVLIVEEGVDPASTTVPPVVVAGTN